MHADPKQIVSVVVAAFAADQYTPGARVGALVIRALPPQQHERECMDIANRRLLARARRPGKGRPLEQVCMLVNETNGGTPEL